MKLIGFIPDFFISKVKYKDMSSLILSGCTDIIKSL